MYFFIVLWAAGFNWLAYRRGFYQFPSATPKSAPHVKSRHLAICFGIYLSLALFIAPLFARFILWTLHRANPEITTLPILLITALQLIVMIVIFALMQSYIMNQDNALFKRIWKDRSLNSSSPIELDLGIGAMSWLLSFPIVLVIGEVIDWILKNGFGYKVYEQTAVKFVKLAASSPFSLIFALLSVLVLAPFIEEFLFRGILQTHLKKRIGTRAAIIFSALLFAFFHFSPSQGLGNIALIFSLFILGGFLGFLYEKQRSLWAPIGLHMTFNVISALRILFTPEA